MYKKKIYERREPMSTTVVNLPLLCFCFRLKPAIEKGIEKGIWEQSSGNSVGQGSYRLLLDDFDPESSMFNI